MRRMARPSSSSTRNVSIKPSMTAGASPSDGSSINEHLRVRDERASDREHLLLAARELRTAVALPLRQTWEQVVDTLTGPFAATVRRRTAGRDAEVLVDGERREEATTLRNVAEPQPGDLVRLQADEFSAVEPNGP